MTRNLAYIISNIDKAVAFEWVAEEFRARNLEVRFILLNPGESYLETFLRERDFIVERVRYRGKRDLPKATLKVRNILRSWQTDTVHAHLFDASLIGLLAAKLAGIPKRIHTRHAGILHHKYHPHAVKYDRWINRLSTHIVSISQATTHILTEMEGVPEAKIRLIPHGFRLEDFSSVAQERVNAVAEKFAFPADKVIIGVVSRYIEWKGIQYIIPAFRAQLQRTPDIHLALCGADGPYADEIKNALSQLDPSTYTEISFEKDNAALYHCLDMCVHVPVDELSEAFGQVYIEAMAARVPMIVTLSGIASEYIRHEHNALVVGYRDSDAVQRAIDQLLTNPEAATAMAEQAAKDIAKFDLSQMISRLNELYHE